MELASVNAEVIRLGRRLERIRLRSVLASRMRTGLNLSTTAISLVPGASPVVLFRGLIQSRRRWLTMLLRMLPLRLLCGGALVGVVVLWVVLVFFQLLK